jgi:hypothetical protein
MKLILGLALITTSLLIASTHSDDFQLIIEPTWHNLQPDSAKTELFGGKWILAGSITFKKKAKEAVNLNKLFLRWNGDHLDDLVASLYRKPPDKEFIPTQEHLVCDGTWNKVRQTLQLTFDQNHHLGLYNTFYLVLTVPESLETLVKQGTFEIVHHLLPEPFRIATAHQHLCLTLDAVDSITAINE